MALLANTAGYLLAAAAASTSRTTPSSRGSTARNGHTSVRTAPRRSRSRCTTSCTDQLRSRPGSASPREAQGDPTDP